MGGLLEGGRNKKRIVAITEQGRAVAELALCIRAKGDVPLTAIRAVIHLLFIRAQAPTGIYGEGITRSFPILGQNRGHGREHVPQYRRKTGQQPSVDPLGLRWDRRGLKLLADLIQSRLDFHGSQQFAGDGVRIALNLGQ